MSSANIPQLELQAAKCRKAILRMVRANGAGHLGPSYSCIDIVTALYFYAMKIDPKNPKMPDRDRFLLSAGHKCMAQYSALAEHGYFDEKILDTFGMIHSKIPGHPDMYKLPGVEANTGSLGHGLNIACGMALAAKNDNNGSRVFVIMGDGELAEGSNWEAAAVASHYKLDNIVVFVDQNNLQISGRTLDVMNFTPIGDHFKGFGWAAKEIDGHDMSQIVGVIDSLPFEEGKPNLIVAHTIKGKGCSFAEGIASFHYWKACEDDLTKAEEELSDILEKEVEA